MPTSTLSIPTLPAPTLDSPTLSELEELTDQAELAREYGTVLSSWAIALEAAFKQPSNHPYCEDFALIFRSADEIRNARDDFTNYVSGDPDYEYVDSIFSILHEKYDRNAVNLAEFYESELGKDPQQYIENSEELTNGIAADIQRGYIELEYFFLTLDPIFSEEYEILAQAVVSYEITLALNESVLMSMEETRERRGCGSSQ